MNEYDEMLIRECEKHNLIYEYKFSQIFIKTMTENWIVDYHPDGFAYLLHNPINCIHSKHEYHKQFGKKIEPDRLLHYILAHERSRYGLRKKKGKGNI